MSTPHHQHLPGVPLVEINKTLELWGTPCPDHHPDCCVCQAWQWLRVHKQTRPDPDHADTLNPEP